MRRLGFLVGLLLGMSAGAQAAERALTVYAAASLTNALQDVGNDFRAVHGEAVKFNFASSSLLARQIEAGAEADIFFSADVPWMDYLDEKRLLRAGSRRDVLSNSLVLIAPHDARVRLKIVPGFALAAALGSGKLALADPDTVPAGRYAKAALTKLGAWDAVAGKLAPAENVRAALSYVARGEAPLGIVYATDAKLEPKVKIVDTFPAGSHPPIVYPVALTARAKSAEAKAFVAYIFSEKGAAVFTRYGFRVIRPPQ
jgi:molybdate transport system substrate-binding protein